MAHMKTFVTSWFTKLNHQLQSAHCPSCAPCPAPYSNAARDVQKAPFEIHMDPNSSTMFLTWIGLAILVNVMNYALFKWTAFHREKRRKIHRQKIAAKEAERLRGAQEVWQELYARLEDDEKAALKTLTDNQMRKRRDAERDLRVGSYDATGAVFSSCVFNTLLALIMAATACEKVWTEWLAQMIIS